MRTSEFLYGSSYDKEFVQEHLNLFHRQIIWAKELIEELQTVHFMDRDTFRINKAIEAIKWNEAMIAQALEKDIQ